MVGKNPLYRGVSGEGFPPQKLTEQDKIDKYGSVDEWVIATINYLDTINYYNNAGNVNETDKFVMQDNINLVKYGKFDTSQYDKLTKPYGNVDHKFPVDLTHYPIINSKVELLRGEEMGRPFNYVVSNICEDAINKVQELRGKLTYDMFLNKFMEAVQKEANAGEAGASTPFSDTSQIKNKDDIDKYISYTYSDQSEKVATQLLQYFIKTFDINYLFNSNFFTYLCTGSAIFCVEEYGDEPSIRIVDPLNFDCDVLNSTEFIEDPAWCREVEFLTAGEVHDRYYEFLTDEDVQYIENIKGDYLLYNYLSTPHFDTTSTSVRVGHYEWKSLKRIGIVYRTEDDGNTTKDIVDEDYVPENGEDIKYYWITERWYAIRIGNDCYIKMGPVENQYSNLDNFSKSRSRYIGLKSSYCIVDKMKPYQFLYNITMYQLKMTMARAKGKAFIMDVAQIPQSNGWDMTQWMQKLDTFGVAWINSLEHGDKGERTTFNQFQTIDRTLGDAIQQYVQQLEFIKNEIADITGISRQREGQINSSETVGGVERSVSQSSAITESLFYLYNEFKKKTLQLLIDSAKAVYKPGKKFAYVLDDIGRQYLEISDDFKFAEFGIFVSNSSDDNATLQQLKQLAQVSLQQKEITLKDFISSIKTKSITETEKILENAERKAAERAAQSGQQQDQQLQKQLQAQQQQIQMEHQLKMEIEQLKSNTSIEVAKINAEAKIQSFRTDMDPDVNDNGLLDVIEVDKLKLQKEKMLIDKNLKEKDQQLKSDEIDIKEKQVKQQKLKSDNG